MAILTLSVTICLAAAAGLYIMAKNNYWLFKGFCDLVKPLMFAIPIATISFYLGTKAPTVISLEEPLKIIALYICVPILGLAVVIGLIEDMIPKPKQK